MMGFLLLVAIIALLIAFSALRRLGQLEERIARLETRRPEEPSQKAAFDKARHPPAPEAEAHPTPPPLPSSVHSPGPEPVESKASRIPPSQAVAPKGKEPMVRASTLRKLHLLPPEGEGTSEVQIASWWATRIGIVLGVIAAVFFGVHVSENTPPLVRLLGLVSVGIITFLVGLKLEKSVAAFGQVLAAGGLAILYVAAFAAYSFEPLRVIESPTLGLGLQFLGVAIMGFFAVWKHSEPVASLAMLLGFVSCWFSHAHDLYSFTLAGLLFFAVVAALLFLRAQWLSTLTIAMIGSYSGYLLLVLTRWSEIPPSILVPASGLLNLLGIFHAAFHVTHLVRRPLVGNQRAAGILTNSSVATLVGFVAFLTLYPDALKWFYLMIGIVALTLSGLEFLKPRLVYLGTTLFLKAITAFTLFAIVAFEGPTEWFAVALQAGILLYTLHRTQSVWIERALILLWLAACVLAFRDWSFARGFHLDRLAGFGFVLIQTSTLSLYQRWASAGAKRRRWISVLAGLAGIQLGLLYAGLHQLPWALLILIGVVSSVAVLSIALRSWIPCLISSAGLVVLAIYFSKLEPGTALAAPGLLSGFLLLAGGVLAAEFVRRNLSPDSIAPGIYRFCAILFSTFILGCFLSAWGRLDPGPIGMALISYAGWAAIAGSLLVAHHWGDRDRVELRIAVALCLGIALALPVARFVPESVPAILDLAFAIAGIMVLLAAIRTRDFVPTVANAVLLSTYLGWVMGGGGTANVPSWHLLVFAPIQLSLVALWRCGRFKPAIWAAILISILGFFNLLLARNVQFLTPTTTGFFHYVIFGLGILVSGLIIASASKTHFTNESTRRLAHWGYPIFTSLILLPTFAWPDTAAFPIATALWGLTGISIFVGGLALRRRAYRAVGLSTLLFCIIRVFVVDLQDTFYRIIAFAAIAILLLVIGYLYTRFRELIEQDDDR
tara:strand:- start:15425 stop:18268 length:2844 start_codon:yes stop_codon:yes gene_type:complete